MSVSGFLALSSLVSISLPVKLKALNPSKRSPRPRLVIIVACLGATDTTIAVQVDNYRMLYPDRPILVIKCPRECLDSRERAIKQLLVAVSVIKLFTPRDARQARKPDFLVHIFSNGGVLMWRTIQGILASTQSKKNSTLSVYAAVYDSAPGSFSVDELKAGLLATMERVTATHASQDPSFISAVPQIWKDWSMSTVRDDISNVQAMIEYRRVYIYSKEDRLIDWRDVIRHAEDAKSKGVSIRLEEFTRSKHVYHAQVDGNRYWGIVASLLDGTITKL